MSDRTHVLIVEDSEESATFLSRILEEHGYPHQVARDGLEAISALRKSPPSLVLLDIMMPRRSGIHVLREMRSDPELKEVPIIVVTGVSGTTGVDLISGREAPKEDEGDVVAHQLGSIMGDRIRDLAPDGLIEKPIDPSLLVGRIQSLLS